MKPLLIFLCLSFTTLAVVHAQDPIFKDTFADVASETVLSRHAPEIGGGNWKANTDKIQIIRSGDDVYVSNGEARSAIAMVPMTADVATGGFTIRAKVRSASRPVNENTNWIALLVQNEGPGSLFSPGAEYIGIMFTRSKSGFFGYTVVSSPKEGDEASPVVQLKLDGAAAHQSWNVDEFNDVVFSYDPAKHTVSLSVNGNEIWANEPVQFPEDVPATGMNQFQIAWNGGYDDTGCTDGRVGPVTVTPLP
jgi:hypothetical protein